MKITLPLPPSINRTYGVNRTGVHPMFKRPIVKEWETEAGYAILRQVKKSQIPFIGPVSIGIKWFYAINRDIDAGLKVLLDVFEKQNVVSNDRQFRRITGIDIAEDKENPRVEVEINNLKEN